jgi:O-6-methylguanine DNA methyltransferase
MTTKAFTIYPSLLGPLQLKLKGSELAGLVLPASPPSEITGWKYWRKGVDWCDILSLKGIKLVGEGTDSFEWNVWHCAKTIPFGETRSYGWIAREIGNPGAYRAVGRALGANPWPLLVPCHRVIRMDGTLGGFSSGLEWKHYLLKFENFIFSPPIKLQGETRK